LDKFGSENLKYAGPISGFVVETLKINFFKSDTMVEPLLSGIVLGLVPVTLAGLFVTAYLQYRRGDRVTSSL